QGQRAGKMCEWSQVRPQPRRAQDELRPHPEGIAVAAWRSQCVSKDGGKSGACCHPSRRSHARACDLLRMRAEWVTPHAKSAGHRRPACSRPREGMDEAVDAREFARVASAGVSTSETKAREKNRRAPEWVRETRAPVPLPPPKSCDCQFHIFGD